MRNLCYNLGVVPGAKGLSPHELAHKWVKDLGTCPDMSIKVGCISHDMRIPGRIVRVRSTEQSAGIVVGEFCPNIQVIKEELKCVKILEQTLMYIPSRC